MKREEDLSIYLSIYLSIFHSFFLMPLLQLAWLLLPRLLTWPSLRQEPLVCVPRHPATSASARPSSSLDPSFFLFWFYLLCYLLIIKDHIIIFFFFFFFFFFSMDMRRAPYEPRTPPVLNAFQLNEKKRNSSLVWTRQTDVISANPQRNIWVFIKTKHEHTELVMLFHPPSSHEHTFRISVSVSASVSL